MWFSTLVRGTTLVSLIVSLMGPTWGQSGADRTQVGSMLAPWTLLSGRKQRDTYNDEACTLYTWYQHSDISLGKWEISMWNRCWFEKRQQRHTRYMYLMNYFKGNKGFPYTCCRYNFKRDDAFIPVRQRWFISIRLILWFSNSMDVFLIYLRKSGPCHTKLKLATRKVCVHLWRICIRLPKQSSHLLMRKCEMIFRYFFFNLGDFVILILCTVDSTDLTELLIQTKYALHSG